MLQNYILMMENNKMFEKQLFDKPAPYKYQRFADLSMGIAAEIREKLDQQGLKKAELAKKLKKSDLEITKYLSGNHNFTLQTIIKLEEALGEELINLPILDRIKLEEKDIKK